jgi:hypothetical protein
MKLQPRPRSSRARAQLSNQLLAYSAASAAALGVASGADAQITLDTEYFDGPLPSISFSKTSDLILEKSFSIGNGQFAFRGGHDFWTDTDFGSRISYFSGFFSIQNRGGFANISFNGYQLGTRHFVFSTMSGRVSSNAFYNGGQTNLNFTTTAGGQGVLPLTIGWDGSTMSLSVAEGGTFTSATAVPEPANVACGLGLVALGFAGIREHRRRRAATAAKKSPASA